MEKFRTTFLALFLGGGSGTLFIGLVFVLSYMLVIFWLWYHVPECASLCFFVVR